MSSISALLSLPILQLPLHSVLSIPITAIFLVAISNSFIYSLSFFCVLTDSDEESDDLGVECLDKDDIFERMDEAVSYFPGQRVREVMTSSLRALGSHSSSESVTVTFV
jgi:hypothetical protein